jgi:hypothetical protein
MKTMMLLIISLAFAVSSQSVANTSFYSEQEHHDGNDNGYDLRDGDDDFGRGRGDGIRENVNLRIYNYQVLDVGRLLGLRHRGQLNDVRVVRTRVVDLSGYRRQPILVELILNGSVVAREYTGHNDVARLQVPFSRGVRSLQLRYIGPREMLVETLGVRLGESGGGRPPGRLVEIRCESFRPLSMECQVPGPISRVYVARQHSSDQCIEGRSWYVNFQNNSIVVTRGCRATFAVEIGGWHR